MIARSFRFAAALLASALLPLTAGAEAFRVREMTGFAESYFSDNFSQPGDWAYSSETVRAAVADGQLTVVTQKNRGGVRLPVKVGPAAGWRAQADVRIVEKTADDKDVFVGMGFSGGLRDFLFVSMDSAGQVAVEHIDHTGKYQQPDPVAKVRAASARLGPGATNTLAVERQDGYFRIFVNGEYVARTRVIDFTPRTFGVMTYSSQPFTASFDNLSLTRTRYDSRFQRLLGQDSHGVGRMLLNDDFTRQDERWWTGEADGVRAQIKDGAYLLTAPPPGSGSRFVYAGAEFGKRGNQDIPVATRFGATVACVAGDCEYARGIMFASPRNAAGGRDQLILQVSNRSLRVLLSPHTGDNRILLDWTTSTSLDGPRARLNLVATADRRLLVFVNDDFQLALALPEGFTVDDVGLSQTGPNTASFDDLDVRHF